MHDEAAPPLAVLEYAEVRPSPARRLRPLAWLLGAALAGAVLGWLVSFLIAPTTWTASGLYAFGWNIDPTASDANRDELQQAVRDHVDEMESLRTLAAVEAELNGKGWGTPPLGSRERMRRGLRIRPIPDSRLVEVSFTFKDPTVAMAVTSAYLTVATQSTPGGQNPTVFAAAGGRRDARYPARIGGAMIGAAVAVAIACVARRQRRERMISA